MVVSQLSLNYVMMDTRFNLFYKLLLFVSFVLTLSLLFYHNSYSPPRYITPATVLTFHQQYREKYLLTLDTNNSTNVPKIAYFIQVAQEQMENANYLVDRILDPFNYYALHINKGMANEELEWGLWLLQQQNQTYSNIFLLERYYSTYEGVTAVDVEVMGMAFMLEKFRDWDYFINLEAGDYPLLPQYSIRDVLREGNVSFMTSWPAECFHVDHRQEVLRYDGALGVDTQGLFVKTKKRPQHGYDFILYKGSQRHILTRQLVKYTVYSMDGYARRLLLFFSNTYLPSEHYFQTLVCNHPEYRQKVANKDWFYENMNGTTTPSDNSHELQQALLSRNFFCKKCSQLFGI
eukprot:TRINITY_DN1495_c1_g2_i6.p1 TRINITY_DN1495_c1_g2~~TRINITY_DN1495_c1_g2_i6.p1  ORF type:complete len:348 (+),score=14.78 TRINITY_DN1495_c1_g2_i6:44-1087(+)